MVINSAIINRIFAIARTYPGLLGPEYIRSYTENLDEQAYFTNIIHGEDLIGRIARHEEWQSIGLEIGNQMKCLDLGVLGYYLHSCKHIFKAYEKLSQYQMLISDVANFFFNLDGSEVHWYLTTPFTFGLENRRTMKVGNDIDMAFRHQIAQALTETRFSPVLVEFVYKEDDPERRKIHEEHFGCPISYDKQYNKIVYRFSDIDKDIKTANSEVYFSLEPVLKQLVSEIHDQGNFTQMTSRVIRNNIGLMALSLENVALRLNMSPRNLQRHLQAEDSSFQQLLDQIQKDVTIRFKNRGFSPGQIADMLGYKATNSFLRAYKRWFGESFSKHQTQSVSQ